MTALLQGPAWRPVRQAKPSPLLAVLPLFALTIGACAVAAVALRPATPALLCAALHGGPWAAAGTALALIAAFALVVALPAALVRPGVSWLLPAWLVFSVGTAGWSLVAVPDTLPMVSIRAATLLLPWMVLGLGGALSGVRGQLSWAAAASGAGPFATARLLTRAAWPGMVRVLLVMLALGMASTVGREGRVAGVCLATPAAPP